LLGGVVAAASVLVGVPTPALVVVLVFVANNVPAAAAIVLTETFVYIFCIVFMLTIVSALSDAPPPLSGRHGRFGCSSRDGPPRGWRYWHWPHL
jgi:Mn2+/Fe2+ NRAMP family transporter